jgi:triacylglycerol lipase
MIAGLLRALTLSAALFALGWGALAWFIGQPWWALLGPLLVLALHAGMLGLEFLLALGVHGDDPAPRPSLGQLLRAWLGECAISLRVFGWWQPWRSASQPDQPRIAGRRGIVFVHGYFCNRGVWLPWLSRCRAQGVPFIALTLEPAFGSIDGYAPIVDAAVARLERETGLAPLIVAHSMGGLAVRAWWAASPDAADRVHHVFTLGTPHRGTWLARFGLTRNAIEMRIGSPWMSACGDRIDVLNSFAARCTCFFSHTDNIVFPPAHARIDGARAIHVAATGHVALVDHPEVVREVESWLAAVPDIGVARA